MSEMHAPWLRRSGLSAHDVLTPTRLLLVLLLTDAEARDEAARQGAVPAVLGRLVAWQREYSARAAAAAAAEARGDAPADAAVFQV
jgi:hypothetical protein